MLVREPTRRIAGACLAPLALTALLLSSCGSDVVTGGPMGALDGSTPAVGGVCNGTTAVPTCVGQTVLACTTAGTWIVQETCGIGQKCQIAGADGATASCVAPSSADAGGDGGFGSDAGSSKDSEAVDVVLADAEMPDAGPSPDAKVGATCTTYQDVQVILANNCNGCHGHQFGSGCAYASNYSMIAAYVANGSMPQGKVLSAPDKALIASWAAGQNTCTPDQCPGAAPDAGSSPDVTDAIVGPGPDAVADTIGGSDAVGPGPDVIGPSPDAGPPPATCGNLKCDAGETAANCPSDCGAVNQCILANCQQQANSCMGSTNCHQAFACDQTCAVGDAACLQQCVAGKSNKTKTNLNNLNTCIANAKCSGGGITPTGNVCDAACGAQGGTVNGKPCYCDNQCAQFGDCCNATATAAGKTCSGSTCAACNGGGTPPGPVCGNGVCEAGETNASCPADCPATPPTCGNGVCDAGETSASCPADCPPLPPVCGNGVCDAGETTASCPADCPAKTCTTYADVQAIFQNNCNGCHGHAFGNGCSSASNYSMIAAYVANGSMPQGTKLSAADKAKVAAWAAAKNACTTASCP